MRKSPNPCIDYIWEWVAWLPELASATNAHRHSRPARNALAPACSGRPTEPTETHGPEGTGGEEGESDKERARRFAGMPMRTEATGTRAEERSDQVTKSRDEGQQSRIEALEERFSRLSAAVLRISTSLDLDTVLREVVDSARALTDARYGIITTVDRAGEPQDTVMSGFTPDEQRELNQWPDGPRLFAHFQGLDAPLRLDDLPAYVRSLGLSPDLMRSKTLQVTPMRHRGVSVGAFLLAEKEGGFTSEDEEILVLFGSAAATAIANARAYRDERQARAELETLVETLPVGVVVFDARTGDPVSFNREARRIVEPLRTPGQPVEKLLEVVTSRRADGREISLAELEFPMAQQSSRPETVRAEEIVLSVPDGRSVKPLVNAIPLRARGGEVESLVVTMQDLAPLEELERLRADFLGMVSHELRAPLISIKGSTVTVLGASPAPEPGRADAVLPGHRPAGRPHAQPHR